MVTSCFGQDLCEGWENDVAIFSRAYSELGISITTKVHTIRDHLVDFFRQHNSGLRKYSEQAFESVNADFSKSWERHLVKAKDNKLFDQRLRQTVLEYNASHV